VKVRSIALCALAALIGSLSSAALGVNYAHAQSRQGIDVSEWQRSIDWPTVAASGISFAYIRATEGSNYVDRAFATNWRGAAAAGVTRGAYLYFHPADDPTQQADLLVSQLQGNGFRGGDIVPAIDVETMDNLPQVAVVASLRSTVDRVNARLGQLPAIYTSPTWWDNHVGSSAFTADPLWVACWCGNSPFLPANNWGGNGWAFWQSTDAGSVPGITGSVDLDQTGQGPLPLYRVPVAKVAALPATESSTTFTLTWQSVNGVPAGRYTVWVQDDLGPWLPWAQTTATSMPFNGWAGHTYGFYAQAFGRDGLTTAGPGTAQTSTAVDQAAPPSTPFTGLYAVDGTGWLHFGSSPPLPVSGNWPGQNAVRGIAVAPGGQGGYVLDLFGGVWPFGNAPGVAMTGYWRGWDIARGIVVRPDGHSGYVLDGYGGVWPFGGAPGVSITGYWRGWDVARGITLRPGGVSGYVVDAYGGVWPFGGAPGVSMSGYWRGWDVARGVVSRSDGRGGYVLDLFGGVWPFGGAPGLRMTGYWAGHDVARGLTLLSNLPDQGYVVDTLGGIWPLGDAPGVVLPNYGTSSSLHGVGAG
jgi:lysozyme